MANPITQPPTRRGGGLQPIEVAADDAGIRLDRWFRRHFPHLTHGRLEKLLRTGQVRVDGKRVKANRRLEEGEKIRVPPLPDPPAPGAAAKLDEAEAERLRAAVLYRDDDVIALNKPPGLAVQGGSNITHHLDALVEALRFGAADRPRLVHRLDKDTSGVLLLGRSANATSRLAAAFRSKHARKLYWALVVGNPSTANGTVDTWLAKRPGKGGERMEIVEADARDARRAITDFRVIERAGRETAWLALEPRTGRTHQLRIHCAALGVPVLGDGKYGGKAAFVQGKGLSRKLHLHARRLVLPHPRGRGTIDVTAPLPAHMDASWRFFGFEMGNEAERFSDD